MELNSVTPVLLVWLQTGRQQISMKSKPKGHVYNWERNVYSDLNEKHISDDDGLSLVKKLGRHWKLSKIEVIYNRNNDSGNARYGSLRCVLRLSHNPSLYLICHEISHLVANSKYGRTQHHNKRFLRCLKSVTMYVRKKYFDFF